MGCSQQRLVWQDTKWTHRGLTLQSSGPARKAAQAAHFHVIHLGTTNEPPALPSNICCCWSRERRPHVAFVCVRPRVRGCRSHRFRFSLSSNLPGKCAQRRWSTIRVSICVCVRYPIRNFLRCLSCCWGNRRRRPPHKECNVRCITSQSSRTLRVLGRAASGTPFTLNVRHQYFSAEPYAL